MVPILEVADDRGWVPLTGQSFHLLAGLVPPSWSSNMQYKDSPTICPLRSVHMSAPDMLASCQSAHFLLLGPCPSGQAICYSP